VISLPEVLFFQPDSRLLQDFKTLVLRC
jgi:hypothetical protein